MISPKCVQVRIGSPLILHSPLALPPLTLEPKHVRHAVRFHDGITSLISPSGNNLFPEGITTFIEVGPSALLCKMGQRALRDADGGGGAKNASLPRRWIATMSREGRIAGKIGLGHVVGAVRGVPYCRRLAVCG